MKVRAWSRMKRTSAAEDLACLKKTLRRNAEVATVGTSFTGSGEPPTSNLNVIPVGILDLKTVFRWHRYNATASSNCVYCLHVVGNARWNACDV